MENVKLVTIEEVCISGSSNISQNKLLENEGDYPIYGASGLIKNVDFYHQDRPYLSIVKDGSGYGRITIMPGKTSVIGTLQYILPKENIMLNYLYYAMLSIDFKKYVSGAAIPHIYFRDYKKEVIILRPLEEQQKIVEKLDKAFELIDQAKANIEQNIINAKELFQSKLDEVFSQKGDGWKEMKLKELAEIKSGFAFKSSSFLKNGKYQIIKMGNVRFGQLRLNESPAFVDEIDIKILEKTLLIKGDVIITQTGTKGKRDYGYSTIIENDNLLLNQRLSYIRPFSKAINYFILYYTWSSFFRDQFFSNENGTVGQGNVSISAIQDAIIIMPSLQCQKNIVKKINQLYNNCQDYENMNLKKLSNLEELRKSILEKAFKGELTN